MKNLIEKFMDSFEKLDKEACVKLIQDSLKLNQIKIPDLYENILAPALNNMQCHNQEEKYCIWEEHVKTAIIRTIIENSYLLVLQERDKNTNVKKEKVVSLCPEGENHDLGAKMVADFFTLEGFEVLYVGANTPKFEFLDLIEIVQPQIIAISITNYYNLVSTKDTIRDIRARVNIPIDILVGGNAFRKNTDFKELGADFLLNSYHDIKRYSKEREKNDTTL